MATAEVGPPQKIASAQKLEPGFQTLQERNPVLPRQEGYLPTPNLEVSFVPPDALPNPRPERVLFGALKDPCLQVVKPVPLDVSVESSNVIVSWAETGEFGTGATLSAAIDDFASGLRELYHQLFASDVNLGSDLQRVKQTLEQYIQLRK